MLTSWLLRRRSMSPWASSSSLHGRSFIALARTQLTIIWLLYTALPTSMSIICTTRTVLHSDGKSMQEIRMIMRQIAAVIRFARYKADEAYGLKLRINVRGTRCPENMNIALSTVRATDSIKRISWNILSNVPSVESTSRQCQIY